jgi:predicted ABC-class ATPase
MTMQRQAGSRPEDIAKVREEAQKKMREEAPPVAPEEVDFYIRLTDHKKVGGLMLPHKLTFLTENEVSEEFEISKYQLNPQFKADRFEKH